MSRRRRSGKRSRLASATGRGRPGSTSSAFAAAPHSSASSCGSSSERRIGGSSREAWRWRYGWEIGRAAPAISTSPFATRRVTASAIRELLIDCLSVAREEDGFDFLVGEPRTITLDEAGRPGWRFPVEARMAARTFANVRLDVVARDDEVSKTQRVELPGVLDFAGLERHEVEVVDLGQHFAEKLHAFTRTYGDRPNTRVRDLPDMVLLIDDGLEPTQELLSIVSRLFEARADRAVPRGAARSARVLARAIPSSCSRTRRFCEDT